MQRIIYKTADGGVAVLIPTDEWLESHTIEELAETVVNRVIDLADLKDDSFRWGE